MSRRVPWNPPLGNEAILTVAESNRFTARVVAVARLLAARGAGVVIMARHWRRSLLRCGG